MQCKDIPNRPILELIGSFNGEWCSWFAEHDRTIRHAMPNGFNLPDKLVLAKMRQLLKRKLIDGCGCGCRGDFVLTNKGKEYLAPMETLASVLKDALEASTDEPAK